MRYIKHYYVEADDPTIVLRNTNQSQTGKILQDIPSRHLIAGYEDDNGIGFLISSIDDEVDLSLYSGVTELTETEFQETIRSRFEATKAKKFIEIAETYTNMLKEYEGISRFTEYGDELDAASTALIAGTEQDAIDAAPSVYAYYTDNNLEANENISFTQLIRRAKVNYNVWTEKVANAGINKQFLLDSLNAIQYDDTDDETAHASIDIIRNFRCNVGY